eukprot:CAMPEP_0177415758 /NCGR_PEP_ID=MMETSP0368-20130122/67746_1 /TAXON_ID=447022 ORGANISM="Scrippsiella hangoei-like, Strain SHHI-4" /NCGR_SAMPLE_ID=MMETSP0368 /ASSEMBLY_ACC=CAM_ASM_000363 /LENGTH=75 /DNA_ID=CAMNT_0018885211 /DNA_START=13 /DNA_END=237 /DNA_ORIENTATION=+
MAKMRRGNRSANEASSMAPASSMAQAESVSATPPTDLANSADQAGGGGVRISSTSDAEAGGSDGSIKAPSDDAVS